MFSTICYINIDVSDVTSSNILKLAYFLFHDPSTKINLLFVVMVSSTESFFVLILFFSNTYLMREVTSVLAGGCVHAEAELARLCFPKALHGPHLSAALILQARCYLSCHNSAPANPAPGRTPQVFYNMKLHKDLSQPNLVCVQRQGLGHSPYRVRLLTLYLVAVCSSSSMCFLASKHLCDLLEGLSSRHAAHQSILWH